MQIANAPTIRVKNNDMGIAYLFSKDIFFKDINTSINSTKHNRIKIIHMGLHINLRSFTYILFPHKVVLILCVK